MAGEGAEGGWAPPPLCDPHFMHMATKRKVGNMISVSPPQVLVLDTKFVLSLEVSNLLLFVGYFSLLRLVIGGTDRKFVMLTPKIRHTFRFLLARFVCRERYGNLKSDRNSVRKPRRYNFNLIRNLSLQSQTRPRKSLLQLRSIVFFIH